MPFEGLSGAVGGSSDTRIAAPAAVLPEDGIESASDRIPVPSNLLLFRSCPRRADKAQYVVVRQAHRKNLLLLRRMIEQDIVLGLAFLVYRPPHGA